MRQPRVFVALLLLATTLLTIAPSFATSTPWQQLQRVPNINPGIMFLLLDGTVLVQDQGANNSGSGDWWILSPDSKGNYMYGNWSRTGSMPSGYMPLYVASGVLPDGRVIVEGGEVNGSATWVVQNRGAIYDPATGKWSAISPPNKGGGTFATIGDAPSVVLASGQFMFGPSGSGSAGVLGQTKQALLNPTDLSWSVTGKGMSGANPEAGYTLLPNNKILMVDTPVNSRKNTELFDPVLGTWKSAGLTPNSLLDLTTALGKPVAEVGPAIVMPNGIVFAESSNQQTALYNWKTSSWRSGPEIPSYNGVQMQADDAGSAILQNGNVLFDAGPVKNGRFSPAISFYEYDGSKIQRIEPPTDQSRVQSNFPYFLALPNGQILVNERLGPKTIFTYTSQGASAPSWNPQIESVPTSLSPTQSYLLTGLQLSGLTGGSSFGDDCNNQTNYPLVKITNNATKDVLYARTFNVTSTSIAPGNRSSVHFTLPVATQEGPSTLQVIASGFTSAPVAVNVLNGVTAAS